MIEQPRQKDVLLEKTVLERIEASWNAALADLYVHVCAATNNEPQQIQSEEIPRALEGMTLRTLNERLRMPGLLVVSSVAGGGKSTVGEMLESLGFERLPRVTTRTQRPGERDGHAYYFVTPEEFERQNAQGAFVYTKQTYGEKRGILKDSIQKVMSGGQRYYAEGDAKAFDVIRNTGGNDSFSYTSLFLLPESFSVVWERMQRRIEQNVQDGAERTEVEKDILERLESGVSYIAAGAELFSKGVYHGFIVNDDLKRVQVVLKEVTQGE